MSDLMPRQERLALARQVDVSETYLWMCLTGRKNARPGLATQIEQVSNGRIKRWQLRTDWRDVWPELAEAHREATT